MGTTRWAVLLALAAGLLALACWATVSAHRAAQSRADVFGVATFDAEVLARAWGLTPAHRRNLADELTGQPVTILGTVEDASGRSVVVGGVVCSLAEGWAAPPAGERVSVTGLFSGQGEAPALMDCAVMPAP